MRVLTCCALATLIACIVPTPATSGEIFICNDGRTIEITPANRAKHKDDPCVAEWFKNNKNAVVADADKAPKSLKGVPTCRKRRDCPNIW